MNWFWRDSAAKPSAEKASPSEPNHASPASSEDSYASPPTQSPESSTKAEQSSSELELMLREFQTTSARASTQSSPSSSTSPFATSGSEASFSERRDWSPSILYPSTMSCMSAFDQAMYCQILGGQFVNYYRYGSMRNCNELWSNYWFCMRTNRGFMSDEEREKRIQAFYIAREARLKKDGSSEDVWEAREEQEVRPWASQQFKWDLRRFEKGEAVLRENSNLD